MKELKVYLKNKFPPLVRLPPEPIPDIVEESMDEKETIKLKKKSLEKQQRQEDKKSDDY